MSESKSNFIEHAELVAQRIGRYANLVGRENVIASSDCGFPPQRGHTGGIWRTTRMRTESTLTPHRPAGKKNKPVEVPARPINVRCTHDGWMCVDLFRSD